MRGEINNSHNNATEPPRLYALGGVFCFNSSKFYFMNGSPDPDKNLYTKLFKRKGCHRKNLASIEF